MINKNNQNIKGKLYEDAVLEKIKYDYGDNFKYKLNYFVKGEVRKTNTEFDIAIFRKNQKHPFWVIECKNWKKKDIKSKLIKEVESFPTKIKNLKTLPDIKTFIITYKPSKGSINTAKCENIKIEIITREEAYSRAWRNVAHKIFPCDVNFHPSINRTILYINNRNFNSAIDEMDNISYDEWLSIVEFSIDKYKETTKQLLECIAKYHYDSGWRFNAIQMLFDHYQLQNEFIKILLTKEVDEDVRRLLFGYQ